MLFTDKQRLQLHPVCAKIFPKARTCEEGLKTWAFHAWPVGAGQLVIMPDPCPAVSRKPPDQTGTACCWQMLFAKATHLASLMRSCLAMPIGRLADASAPPTRPFPFFRARAAALGCADKGGFVVRNQGNGTRHSVRFGYFLIGLPCPGGAVPSLCGQGQYAPTDAAPASAERQTQFRHNFPCSAVAQSSAM